MKKNFIFTFLFMLFTSYLSYGSDSYSPLYSSLADYTAKIDGKGLPRVAIIGCGHQKAIPGIPEDHSHPDAFTFDMEESTKYQTSIGGNKKRPIYCEESKENPHYKLIQADANLDILDTNASTPYKNTFDIVVLERPYAQTLDEPSAIYNALSLLRVGGMLVIDLHNSYHLDSYRKVLGRNASPLLFAREDISTYSPEEIKDGLNPSFGNTKFLPPYMNIFESSLVSNITGKKRGAPALQTLKEAINLLEQHGLKTNYNLDDLEKKLEPFRTPLKTYYTHPGPDRLGDLATFLSFIGLGDVVAFKGYQPYANRQDSLLVIATKNQLADDLMTQRGLPF